MCLCIFLTCVIMTSTWEISYQKKKNRKNLQKKKGNQESIPLPLPRIFDAFDGPSLLGRTSALKCGYDSIVRLRPSCRKSNLNCQKKNTKTRRCILKIYLTCWNYICCIKRKQIKISFQSEPLIIGCMARIYKP